MKKIITKFYFDRATYRVGDDFGNEVFVEIDYKNSQFVISEINSLQNISEFKQKIVLMAQQLITKKHNVNFSDRIYI